MTAETIPLPSAELQAPPAGQQTAGILPPLLYDSGDLCAVLRISKATLHRLLAAGKLPKPIRLSGLKWPVAEIEAFVAMGCPPRAEFEARREAVSRGSKT